MANRVARHDTTRTRLNTTRFDTNTVGHDYLSCRVVFAGVQKPRHEHDTKGIVSCRAGTTTRPAHRAVSTRTRFTEKNFIRDNFFKYTTFNTTDSITIHKFTITEHHRDNTEHHRDNFFKFELVQWLPH
jgi:hypothetical protein